MENFDFFWVFLVFSLLLGIGHTLQRTLIVFFNYLSYRKDKPASERKQANLRRVRGFKAVDTKCYPYPLVKLEQQVVSTTIGKLSDGNRESAGCNRDNVTIHATTFKTSNRKVLLKTLAFVSVRLRLLRVALTCSLKDSVQVGLKTAHNTIRNVSISLDLFLNMACIFLGIKKPNRMRLFGGITMRFPSDCYDWKLLIIPHGK